MVVCTRLLACAIAIGWLSTGIADRAVAQRDQRAELNRGDVRAVVPNTWPAQESSNPTPPDTELAGRVDAVMTQAVPGGFGGAVVMERDGRVLLSTGYGFANRQRGIRFTTETIAPINSITKSVTALAAMQLAAKGRIDLEASVGAYLAGAGEPAASSRVRDVLVHRAGLPPHCGEDWDRRTKAQLIGECTRQPLAAPRGALSYSNPGYSYLAAIVEELSGRTWEDYLRVHVFEPAGMNRSGWPFGKREAPEVADAYVNDVPRVVPADRLAAIGHDVWNWKGNGELHASASDMHRFYQFLIRQPARILEAMTTPQTAEYAPGVRDGYGFALRFDRSGRIYRIGSSGSDGAFVSVLHVAAATARVHVLRWQQR